MNSCLELASNGKRITLVDYLKGFAIFTIVLMHLLRFIPSLPSPIITLSAVGGTGAHVFILCSGIGLYTSYLHRKTGYWEFIKKRFLKIYIPYIIVILVSFLLPWMYPGDQKGTALLSHIFLFKMFVPQFTETFGVQFWFISTIFQLYLLFIPLCLLKNKLKTNKLFIGLTLSISIVWWIFCSVLNIGNIRIWNSFCLQYLWEFALGFVIAEAFYHGKSYQIKTGYLLIAAIAGIALQAGFALFSDVLRVFNDIPALLGYTCLALLLCRIPLVKKLCLQLSVISYECFLIHILVFFTTFYFIRPQGLLMECLSACLSLVIVLVLAYCYRLLIKRIGSLLKR